MREVVVPPSQIVGENVGMDRGNVNASLEAMVAKLTKKFKNRSLGGVRAQAGRCIEEGLDIEVFGVNLALLKES